MLRFFMDTSVLISAIYSAHGHARDLLTLAAREAPPVRLVISDAVMLETRRNIVYKSPERLAIMRRLIAAVPFETVNPAPRLIAAAARRFPITDAVILAAARKTRPAALVTFDEKHLLRNPAVAEFVRAPVLRPGPALALIKAAD